MRKSIVMLSVLFVTLVGFTSCGIFATKGTLVYEVIKPNSIYNSTDGKVEFLDVFKVSITYKNAKGDMVTIADAELPWSYTAEVASPFKAEIHTKVTVRELEEYPSEFPEPHLGLTCMEITSGDVYLREGACVTGTGNVSWKYVDEWLRAYGDTKYTLLFDI